MSRFSDIEKLNIARRYTSGLATYRQLASETGIDASAIRYWVMLERHHGHRAFAFPYTNYPASFKLQVIEFIQNTNYSIREASAIFHLPDPSMGRRWVKKWEKDLADVLGSRARGTSVMAAKDNDENKNPPEETGTSLEALIKENEQLRMENAYLKKLDALVQKKRSRAKKKRK